MSFRKIQRLRLAGYSPVFESAEVKQKSGNIDYQLENKADVRLPPSEFFDLTNQLESGISLEEVNSKVMAAKSVNANSIVRKYTKQINNNSDEGEK